MFDHDRHRSVVIACVQDAVTADVDATQPPAVKAAPCGHDAVSHQQQHSSGRAPGRARGAGHAGRRWPAGLAGTRLGRRACPPRTCPKRPALHRGPTPAATQCDAAGGTAARAAPTPRSRAAKAPPPLTSSQKRWREGGLSGGGRVRRVDAGSTHRGGWASGAGSAPVTPLPLASLGRPARTTGCRRDPYGTRTPGARPPPRPEPEAVRQAPGAGAQTATPGNGPDGSNRPHDQSPGSMRSPCRSRGAGPHPGTGLLPGTAPHRIQWPALRSPAGALPMGIRNHHEAGFERRRRSVPKAFARPASARARGGCGGAGRGPVARTGDQSSPRRDAVRHAEAVMNMWSTRSRDSIVTSAVPQRTAALGFADTGVRTHEGQSTASRSTAAGMGRIGPGSR